MSNRCFEVVRLVSSRLALVRPVRVIIQRTNLSRVCIALYKRPFTARSSPMPLYIKSAKGKARAVAIGATSSQAFEAGSNRSTE